MFFLFLSNSKIISLGSAQISKLEPLAKSIFKTIKLSELMSKWQPTRFDELFNIVIGGTPSRNNSSYWDTQKDQGNLWVSIRDMNQSYIEDTAEYITDLGISNSNAKTIPKGSVLMSFKLSIGKISIAGKNLYTNEAIAALLPKNNKIHNDFLFQGLKYWDLLQTVDTAVKGGTLNKRKLKEIEILIPENREEQRQIATILSTLDKAIATTEQLISKYQRIKTGLLHDLLTCGIDEQGNLRSEKTHQFKNSPLGRIPVEWEVKTLGELNHFITSGSRNWARFYSIEGALFLRITNLIRENINFKLEDIKRVNIQNNDEGLRTKLQEGDILISITADLGIIGVIPDSFEEAYINQHIALYRILERENYNSRFLGHFLSSSFAQEQFVKLNDGGAKAGLNLPTILKIKIPKIDINEQEIISARLDKSDALIVKLKSNLSKFQSLKTGLMQDLLSGKVRVK